MVATDPWARLAEMDAENTRLREELAQMRVLLASANANISELSARIAELSEAVAKGNDRIKELLAVVQRRKRKSKSKGKKEPEPPPSLDDEARKAFTDRPQPPPAAGPMHDRPRPKQRPTGRKPLPDHLPADESTVEPSACGCCGHDDLDWVDEVVEEKLDVKSHQRRRITHRRTGCCKRCGTRTTGEAPPSPFRRSKVTCRWLAWFIVQKFRLQVPLDRIRTLLNAQGVPLSISFLVSQTTAAVKLLDAIDGEHWKQLLAGSWMGTDATGFKVQLPGVGLHHGHLEVYHRYETVVFQYEAEKGGETQADKLATFEGTLVVDAESRYNETIRRHPLISEANCNAHPRRKLRDAEKVQPVLAWEAGRFVGAMFDADGEARNRELTGAALLKWREDKIRPLTKEFLVWMDAVEPTLIYSDPLAKIIRYYRRHWAELFRFIDDPACIPMDNSGSERLFQPVAKLRLNSLFAGGTEGAHRAAVVLGIIATCKRLKVDPEAYLTWVFVRRGTHREKYPLTAADLTPAAYKRGLAGA